jgi:hypothetical protein
MGADGGTGAPFLKLGAGECGTYIYIYIYIYKLKLKCKTISTMILTMSQSQFWFCSVPTGNIQSTEVEGNNIQFFKDLKITTDKYVLHSDFHAIDMNDVNIILGYPWMESVSTVNVNVQKKFLKIWYKRKKITLQDMSLIKLEEPTGATKEVIAVNIIVELEVESEAEPTDTYEQKSQEGLKKEAKELHDSKEPHVEESKSEEPRAKVVIYRHPHYLDKQQSSRQEHGHQHTYYGLAWHPKDKQSRDTWRHNNNAWRHHNTARRN